MPLFDFLCLDCGKTSELLVFSEDELVGCGYCESRRVKKLLGAPASCSGSSHAHLPGPGDTACCGVSPHQASCAGPGSCCGHH